MMMVIQFRAPFVAAVDLHIDKYGISLVAFQSQGWGKRKRKLRGRFIGSLSWRELRKIRKMKE